MENWRRQKLDNHRQELSRSKSTQYKKPPRGSWQPRVPLWEKEFCKVVGSLDWETFLNMKKFIHLYNNVIEWNDSAGEEAFHDAKKRFWAKTQGLPCDVSLPDPDLYIDEINWHLEIDPELLLELECKPEIPDGDESHETVVIFGDALLANQAFFSTGWGDKEENFKIPTSESPADYGNPGEHDWDNAFHDGTANGCPDYRNNTWNVNHGSGAIRHMPWEGGWNSTWDWNHSNGHNNYEVKPVKPKNFEDKREDNVQGSWDVNNMGRVDGARQYFSRYRTSRFQGNEHHKNHMWWKDRGRRR
ncbi:uncharacterized protein Fot_04417 [Forsythia ovata]|uniref:Uncharacterized protein n=1 Tax=Forsythia ovata TaxID=205694 RepID=A0ABD1XCJ7_9LAMI